MKKEILLKLIRQRKSLPESGKYVLFVGAGASLSSGSSLFSKIFESVDADTYDDFSEKFSSLSDNERFALLEPHIKIRKPSQSARCLARLIKEGYFSLIITTNFDDLIERALHEEGVGRHEIQCLIHHPSVPLKDLDVFLSYETPRIKIIKTHGDFLMRKFAITLEETLEFSSTVSNELARVFKNQDLIILGSKFADLDLLKCIPLTGSGSIWYVNPTPPQGEIRALMKARKCDSNYIDDEDGSFDCFMNDIARLLGNNQPFKIGVSILSPFVIGMAFSEKIEVLLGAEIERRKDLAIISHIPSIDPSIKLFWFDEGYCTWLISSESIYCNIFEFALDRKATYVKLLNGHEISHLTRQICLSCNELKIDNVSTVPTGIGYAFSIVNLIDSIWDEATSEHATKLLACPSLLDDRLTTDERLWTNCSNDDSNKEVLQLLQRSEAVYLHRGVSEEIFHCFSVPGVISGFACWAGVAFQRLNSERCLPVSKLIEFEVELQACWWLLHKAIECLEEDNKDFIEFLGKSNIERRLSKLLSIGPTEGTQYRLYKEAIVKSSRIEKLFADYRELQRQR